MATRFRFLGFAGMFAAQRPQAHPFETRSGRFVPARFSFELPGLPTAMPANVDGRLHQVARAITDPLNPRFAKTMVNRLWKRYFGLGLYEPADDYRDDTAVSHPELLDWLADDFMRHGYDLQRTVRLMLTSRTYQLRYDPKLEDHYAVGAANEPRYFRSPALRKLTAEQFIDCVHVITRGTMTDNGAAI